MSALAAPRLERVAPTPPESVARIRLEARNVYAERGRVRELRLALHSSQVPMLTVDNERRIVDANLGARLLLRLQLGQLRHMQLDLLTHKLYRARWNALWEQLLARGQLWASDEFFAGESGALGVAFIAVANVLPGEHLIVLAPAEWPGDELGPADEPQPKRGSARLSRRQLEVLGLFADGLSVAEIAERLAISPATARTHGNNLLRKLGARNRAHAVALAAVSGLLADAMSR
jgi:DNA-binding CsgD family transcriptional regulator